jgi:hypothetical protein
MFGFSLKERVDMKVRSLFFLSKKAHFIWPFKHVYPLFLLSLPITTSSIVQKKRDLIPALFVAEVIIPKYLIETLY